MSERPGSPLIVAFVSDLMFATRIGNAARGQGFRVEWVESPADLGQSERSPAFETPGESLHGETGQLFARLTRWQPALLVFDLGEVAIPWRIWIAALKGSPATRRMPILCFGPHVDLDKMNEAKRVGADAVLARSRFAADLPNLLLKYARLPDREALSDACSEPLSPLAVEGIALHNQGDYFEAHESLEHAWQADEGPGRDLYRGMLQISVAFLQVERGNFRGAVKMCLRVRQWLDPLPDNCRGVDVAHLRQTVERFQNALEALGPERLGGLDPDLLQPIRYVETGENS
jgi:predicted metal-dependent hydrolase